MKTVSSILALSFLFGCVAGRVFRFQNGCPFTVWVGALNNDKFQLPQSGGWRLDPRQQNDVNLQDDWQGRFWGRTGCDGNGRCETGDCGSRIECGGAGGVPPVTLAEFTLNGGTYKDTDFYDVSLVDGFNLPMRVTPVNGRGGRCATTECRSDVNANCPDYLRQKNGRGDTIACQSDCTKYRRDDYCCTNYYGTPDRCPQPPIANYFNRACPAAYSYAYDDLKGTFTCQGANYVITFCP